MSSVWTLGNARSSRADAIELLSALVSIESVNPSLVPAAVGEAAIADYVARWLHDAGVQVELIDAAPGRPSVIGRIPGSADAPSLILNAHLDTVGIGDMAKPFQPRVEGDRLYGRGAYDMKSGLTAMMLAARTLASDTSKRGEVIVTAVADEEYASLGTQQVLSRFHADGAIVTEPTGLRLCVAHKGFAWITVETHGTPAHGSKPDRGVDAIAHMGRVLVEVEELGRTLGSAGGHPLLGTGSVHASTIEGGQELSSYPGLCRLQVERRTVPGETRESVTAEFDSILTAEAQRDENFRGGAEVFFWRDPFEVGLDESIVRAVSTSAARVCGKEATIYGDTPWMDAALLSAAGIPTVVFGPGGAGAHATTEYAFISELVDCAEILVNAARDFCGTNPA